MATLDCRDCKNCRINLSRCTYECTKLNCYVNYVEHDIFDEHTTRMVPELGEEACPGKDPIKCNEVIR